MLGTTTTGTTTTTTDMLLLQSNNTDINNPSTAIMAQLPFYQQEGGQQHTSSEPAVPEYNPLNCLFCCSSSSSSSSSSTTFSTPEETIQHMQKRHGLFIPHKEKLAVEMDTLLSYLHLIIFGYRECLYCHTTRRTVEAVQQHMMGKGHCRFDVSSATDDEDEDGDGGERGKNSEFRDFYDFDDDEEEEEDNDDGEYSEGEDEQKREAEDDDDDKEKKGKETTVQLWTETAAIFSTTKKPTKVDETSMRLPSGKIASVRSSATPASRRRRHHHHPKSRSDLEATSETESEHEQQQRQPGASSSSSSSPDRPATSSPSSSSSSSTTPQSGPKSKALQKQDRQTSHLAIRLSNLRAEDRRSLAHLSAPQQRSIMTLALRQAEKSDRAERQFRARMDGLGNVKSKERFVNDVPGGKSHKNRFFAQ